MKKVLFSFAGLAVIGFAVLAFTKYAAATPPDEQPAEIKWCSLEDAQKLNSTTPRKIFIDVSTSWCSWCKVMDANTFHNPTIVKYMNDHFYCVKFDAETRDTVVFGGQKFWNEGPADRRSPHNFAIALLQGHLSYPSFAFIAQDTAHTNVTLMQGYMPPEKFEPYLHYYGENLESKMSWDDFIKQFKSELPPPDPNQQQQTPAPAPH